MSDELKELEKRYPSDEFKKMTFQFTRDELARMVSLETIAQTAQLTVQSTTTLINSIFDKICLVRVGVENTPDIGKVYDTVSGTFWAYVPRKKKETKK